MSKTKTSAFSGCLIGVILIMVIGSCILPVFFIIGTVSCFSDFAIKTTGGWLCPKGSTPESYSYPTTTRAENGFEQPLTAYELHCVDSGGEVVKNDPVLYAFIWIGILVALGVVITAILSFIFSVPGGMLVSKLFEKLNSSKARMDPSK